MKKKNLIWIMGIILIVNLCLVYCQETISDNSEGLREGSWAEPVILSEEQRQQLIQEIIAMEAEKARQTEKENPFFFLKYIFGEIPKISYQFIFCLSIWLFFLSTLLLIQAKLNYPKKLKLLLSIFITITLANLSLNSYLSSIILASINSAISRIFMLLLIAFTIFLELKFSHQKNQPDNKPLSKG